MSKKVNTLATRVLKQELKHWRSVIRYIIAFQNKINQQGVDISSDNLIKAADTLTDAFIIRALPLCDRFIDTMAPVRCWSCPIVRVKNQSDGCRSIKFWENLSKAKESAVRVIQHLLDCRQSRKFKDETHAVVIAEVSLKLGTLTARVDMWLTFLDEVEKEYTDLVWRRYNKLIGRSKHNENNQDTDGI